MYYDVGGKEISVEEWTQLRGGEMWKAHHHVTHVGSTTVSTVWLGLDHQYGDGPPLIFETLVFGAPLDEVDGMMERYSTKEQAREGHEHMVAKVREMMGEN